MATINKQMKSFNVLNGSDTIKYEIVDEQNRGEVTELKSAFDNEVLDREYADNDLQGTIKSFLATDNVIYQQRKFEVGSVGGKYQQKVFYTLSKTFTSGEIYFFYASSISGNTNTAPYRANVKHGTNTIRSISASSGASVVITDDDITAEVDSIEFFVYASTSTALTQVCVLTAPYVIKGLEKEQKHYTDLFLNTVEDFVNRINLGTIVNGFVNSNDGTIYHNVDSYKVTDYIPIKANKIKVCVTSSASQVGLAFFDNAKCYVSGVDFSGYTLGNMIDITVPYVAKYVVYSAINAQESNMAMYDISLPVETINPCFWTESEECRVFKKILCIGDSLTEGAFEYNDGGTTQAFFVEGLSYPSFLASITGRQTTNAGDSGETTVSWYSIHGQEDFSGHDACIIALGRNDYANNNNISSEDRITAMTNIINKVKADNPQIPIFICNQLNYYNTIPAATQVNTDMATLASTIDDCYLVDLFNYGVLNMRRDAYSHCTAIGYSKLARYIFNYVSYIIHMNYADFKTVQFVGTTHSFT